MTSKVGNKARVTPLSSRLHPSRWLAARASLSFMANDPTDPSGTATEPTPVSPVVPEPAAPPRRNRPPSSPAQRRTRKGQPKAESGPARTRRAAVAEALAATSPVAPPVAVYDEGILYTSIPKGHDGKTRAHVAAYLQYRLEGLQSTVEIAERIGITSQHLQVCLQRAAKEGWLVFSDPLERFQNKIVPKVVDNIEHFIDAKDKQMTIEAAKGAGIFKSHQAIKTESETPTTVLALKIETTSPPDIKIASGSILGVAREGQ